MRLHIAVIAGPHQGQVFTFTGHDTFLVGRSKIGRLVRQGSFPSQVCHP
jgi:hypothetical protein